MESDERNVTSIDWHRKECQKHGCEMIQDIPTDRIVYIADWFMRYRNDKWGVPVVAPCNSDARGTFNTPILRTMEGFNVAENCLPSAERQQNWDYAIPDLISVTVITGKKLKATK